MKLQVVQLFLRSLIEPLTQSAGVLQPGDEVRRACDLIASFGDIEVAQFGELLREAEDYRRTKELAVPRSLRPLVSCYDRLRSLKTRATSADNNKETLVQELNEVPLDAIDRDDLVSIIGDLGWTVSPKATKKEAIQAVRVGLTGAEKLKKRASRPAAEKPEISVHEFAQRLSALKEQANSPEQNRDDLGKKLKEMKLDSLTGDNLLKIATELGCSLEPGITKDEIIEALWRTVTGAGRLEPYTKKIKALERRANSEDSTIDELTQSLKDLQLEQLSSRDLIAVARQLSCDVNARTTKPEAISAIERVVLVAKETLVGNRT